MLRPGFPLTNTPKRLSVLILAYSISPVRGSEYSVGWNHVWKLCEHCDLTVLYGLSGPHMGDVSEIESYLSENGAIPNVKFISVKPNLLAQIANSPNRNGKLVYSFYIAYRIWHAQAARRAREIIATEQIDLVHYLCPIGYREPGFLWKIDRPYVWGPVGGMTPTLHLKGAPRPWKAKAKVAAKNLLNITQLTTSRRVARALSRADVVVSATTENGKVMRSRFGTEALHIPENAILDEWLRPTVTARASHDDLNLIWIGTLDYRKSPDLLIDVMSRITNDNWRLDIVGDGPLAGVAKAAAANKGLAEKINFHGQLPRSEVLELLTRSDLHLITSMGEGNPTVIWEAMAVGVPTMALNHCGMHDVVCDCCGVRVEITDYNGTCDNFAVELNALMQDHRKLAKLAEGVLSCRTKHLWSVRAKEWLKVYRQTVENYKCTRGL
jgi:glycosyltransferase involved in cell wall biosynthesis